MEGVLILTLCGLNKFTLISLLLKETIVNSLTHFKIFCQKENEHWDDSGLKCRELDVKYSYVVITHFGVV
jgi:hypothetical protein